MSDRLRMDAYYYSFEPTGVIEIDRILSEVASAGKGFHHTECWSDPMDWRDDGKSHEDLIQDAANAAAETFRTHPDADRPDRNEDR